MRQDDIGAGHAAADTVQLGWRCWWLGLLRWWWLCLCLRLLLWWCLRLLLRCIVVAAAAVRHFLHQSQRHEQFQNVRDGPLIVVVAAVGMHDGWQIVLDLAGRQGTVGLQQSQQIADRLADHRVVG